MDSSSFNYSKKYFASYAQNATDFCNWGWNYAQSGYPGICTMGVSCQVCNSDGNIDSCSELWLFDSAGSMKITPYYSNKGDVSHALLFLTEIDPTSASWTNYTKKTLSYDLSVPEIPNSPLHPNTFADLTQWGDGNEFLGMSPGPRLEFFNHKNYHMVGYESLDIEANTAYTILIEFNDDDAKSVTVGVVQDGKLLKSVKSDGTDVKKGTWDVQQYPRIGVVTFDSSQADYTEDQEFVFSKVCFGCLSLSQYDSSSVSVESASAVSARIGSA